MTSQIKRAATSIPLNIAEGYGKAAGPKETMRYLQMARGSCCEMTVLLDMLRDFRFIDVNEHEEYDTGYEEVGKMLTGLMKSITKN